jgi:hypothetical protein
MFLGVSPPLRKGGLLGALPYIKGIFLGVPLCKKGIFLGVPLCKKGMFLGASPPLSKGGRGDFPVEYLLFETEVLLKAHHDLISWRGDDLPDDRGGIYPFCKKVFKEGFGFFCLYSYY